MNENLNLVEILKDCPKGTKLYSTIHGEIEFGFIADNSIYPIVLILNGGHEYITSDGKLFNQFDGECILFPSREERDWSKFNQKKDWFVPPCEFKDGDIVATYTGSWIGITTGGHAHRFMPTYCVLRKNSEVKLYFGKKIECGFDRLATEEEKQRLFDAIKERGYKWNAETKTLEKFVESKFDPKTLQPFDKVLAKVGSYWRIEWFSHMYEYKGDIYYACAMSSYKECIPYNDETKHLLDTSDEAPEYYRYWDD